MSQQSPCARCGKPPGNVRVTIGDAPPVCLPCALAVTQARARAEPPPADRTRTRTRPPALVA
jgi:hypothetical protein